MKWIVRAKLVRQFTATVEADSEEEAKERALELDCWYEDNCDGNLEPFEATKEESE